MEYRLEAETFWPSIDSGSLGIRDGVLVPPVKLDDPEIVEFESESTVVTPGWFNSHAHLELSGCGDIDYDGNFADWIRNVLEFKLSLSDDEIRNHFQSGCKELVTSGVAHVVDHCDRTDLILDELSEVDLNVLPFKELVAFSSDQVDESVREARGFLKEADSRELIHGLAPHAPYSAHPEVYEWSYQQVHDNATLSTHLHEVTEEIEFVEQASGPLMKLLEDRNGTREENPYDGNHPIPYFTRQDLFDEPLFGIHMNHLNEEDLRWLEVGEIRPVFCPKSYSYFGHETFPPEAWVERAIPFALGTDSLASNTSLDMLSELERLDELTDQLTETMILEGLTKVPANTLGVPDRGVLSWGTPADLSIFDVPSGRISDLAQGKATPLGVVIDGEFRWAKNRSSPEIR